MGSFLIPELVSVTTMSLLVAALYLHLFLNSRDRILQLWSAAWGVYSLRFVIQTSVVLNILPPWMVVLQEVATLTGAFLCIAGAKALADKPAPAWWWYGAGTSLSWVVLAQIVHLPFFWADLPISFFTGLLFFWSGIIILRQTQISSPGRTISGYALILWGIHRADYTFLRPVTWFAPWGFLLAAVLFLTAAIGILLLYYDKIRAKLEHEINERSLAQKSFVESEKDLKESQRIAHVGSWRLDVASNQVVWSDELYKMYGFDPTLQPPPYTEHQKLFTPESWERLSTALNKTKEEGIPYELELKTVREDGSHGWMWVHGEALRDASDAITTLWGAAQDITERKLAENKLIETELRYRALFENMTAGFVLFEVVQDDMGTPIDLVIVAANKGFEITTGLKTHEVIGERLTRVLSGIENDAADWIGTYGKVALTGEPRQFELGSELLGNYFSIIAYQSGPKQCAVTFVDITDRKRSEKERERLLTAIEQTDDIVIITAPDGKIQFVNPAFKSVTGYTQADVLGQTPRLLKSGKQDQAFYSDLWETISSGNVWKGRMVNKCKDGTLYNEESTISPVKDAEGRIVNFVSVKRDITEYMRISEEKNSLEKQLIQAQKMESVGRLAGGIAHDYNNISSIIIGFSELALEKVDQSDPLHDDLMEIFTAAKRSTDITRQLLAFARQQTIAPKVLDLNKTVESMLKMLQRLIGEDIDLAWLPGSEVCLVKIDPSQIDQILANLCVNARDAIVDVGKVTIETKNISFDEDYCADHAGFVPGDFVMLVVSDNGSGITPEDLNNIFEPFFTTKGQGKGTGLGLATVYGIIKQNNGFINVYSEPGKGTSIKIYLPRHTGPTVEAHSEKYSEIPLSIGHEVVLLVEDDASILKLGKRIIEDLGYVVLSANSPNEAIKLAEKHTGEVNLLITDVVMPEMNGRELSEQMNRLYPNLKTLFMSGYTANVIAHRGVLEDGVCFIPKPFSKEDLAVKVREALDSEDI